MSAAAAQDDPELRDLESAYLGKKFTEPAKKTGKGKAKAKDPERCIVQAIVWSDPAPSALVGYTLDPQPVAVLAGPQ
jgi:hypothetical protein